MFITFEGIEGAGKGTLLEKITCWLAAKNVSFLLTREPGGSELGKNLRSILLDATSKVVPQAELFLYLADRAQHVQETIKPALAAGRVVLSDRYADSTMVYQGYGRGLNLETLKFLNDIAVEKLWPDLTFILDLPVENGLGRANKRNAELGLTIKEGRFEAESLAFHERVRQGYLESAKEEPERFVVVDSSQPVERVFADVCAVLGAKLQLFTV